MRRGIFSLICYILYTLAGGALAIYGKLEADRINASGGGWEGLGAAIVFIIGLIALAVGVAGLLFKGLHIGTGWGIFGFVCILLDLAVIIALVSTMFSGSGSFEFNPVAAILCGIIGISFVSNVESLRR